MQNFCDNRGMSGYGSALLYKSSNETLYHLLVPLEGTPSVVGSLDTFEYDLLNCSTKGQVEGKYNLEQSEIKFLWHRDNVKRLEDLQDKVLDFLIVYQDFTARKFTGTFKVSPDEAGADVMRGTITFTPTTAETTTILDARDLIMDTVIFTSQIDSSIKMTGTTHTVVVNTDPTNATFEITSNNDNFAGNILDGKLTITYSGNGSTKEYAVIYITAKADGYASWTTSIALENNVTSA